MYQETSVRRWPAATGGRLSLLALGPAFVAGIAYVDPGNVATNFAAGSTYGYLLVWVVVAANFIAVLIQYLSAKLGIATRRNLPQLCREKFPRHVSWGLWLQAEAVALATDLAEVLGGAVALHLLFDLPLLVGGVITGVVSFLVLSLQRPERQRRFELAIVYLLSVIVLGFIWAAVVARPSPAEAVTGLVPSFADDASVLLAAGILGATVMPHAIYLHSALVVDRFGSKLRSRGFRHAALRATRVDVVLALAVAGAVNIAMMLAGAGALQGRGVESLDDVYTGLGSVLGQATAVMFAVGLLASGFASSSVGTYAGSVILEGFLQRRIALPVRRLITLAPALLLIALGLDPTQMLIVSQVVLSFGIPFALWSLVILTRNRPLMGDLVNRRGTTAVASVAAMAITVLNVMLVVLTVTGT